LNLQIERADYIKLINIEFNLAFSSHVEVTKFSNLNGEFKILQRHERINSKRSGFKDLFP
jgi:hypothetical protein